MKTFTEISKELSDIFALDKPKIIETPNGWRVHLGENHWLSGTVLREGEWLFRDLPEARAALASYLADRVPVRPLPKQIGRAHV